MDWLEEQKRQNELNRQNLINSYRQGRTGDYFKNTASVIDSGSKLLQGGTNAANFGQKVQDFGSKLGSYDNSFIKSFRNNVSKAGGIGTLTKGLSSVGDIANGDYIKGGLGTVSTVAPLFGGAGIGIGLAADLGSKLFDIFGGNEKNKAIAMAQSQKGLENIQSFSNQIKDENAKQLEQQGNVIQQQLAQNSGMQDLYGAYQAGQPTYDDYIKEIYGL